MRALSDRPDLDLLVYGDSGILTRAAAAMNLHPPDPRRIRNVTQLALGDVVPGQPNLCSGRAQVAYLAAATEAACAGKIDALVTAPISKEWAARAGFAFPGHTEYLADATGVSDFAMMLAGPQLRVVLVTIHVGIQAMLGLLTPERIARTVVLTANDLQRRFAIARPRIAVAALNPHAGEAGQFGDEEARVILPGIEIARQTLLQTGCDAVLTGPHVPDVVFRQAADGRFDAVVAMYHDQGLIPIKLLHFDNAVNVTLGLPFARTSPDHGTAYDIAGSGTVRPHSFLAAIDLAAVLAKPRAP